MGNVLMLIMLENKTNNINFSIKHSSTKHKNTQHNHVITHLVKCSKTHKDNARPLTLSGLDCLWLCFCPSAA